MTSTVPEIDPLADLKTPSLSWKNAALKTTHKGIITRVPTILQSMDYETGKPAFWPAGEDQDGVGNPKMAVVLSMRLMDTEEEVSVWAVKPSSMLTALVKAQKDFGRRIEVGGELTLQLVEEKPNQNKRLAPQKIYSAIYEGPAEQPIEDPLGLKDFS